MERHQRDARVLLLVLVLLTDERDELEEFVEGRVGVTRCGLHRDAGKLLQVLDAALRLDRALGLELQEIAGLLSGELDHACRAGALVEVRLQRRHHLVEAGDRAPSPGVQQRVLVDAPARFDDVDPLRRGERLDRRHRSVADPALGHVHDPPERDDVLRIQQQPKVAEHVLDLAPLVEPHASEDAVGGADPHEHVLDHAGHRVRPVEDRDVAVAEPLLVAQALDLARDEQRLLVLVVPTEGRHQLAGRRVGPELLGLSLGVVLDHGVRRGQDVAGRPVVLRHHEHGGVGVVALEVEHVLDRRAAPRIDALVGVADDADVAVAARERVHQLVLGPARVLVLVDQQVAEPLLVVAEHLGLLPEQPDRLGDQVVEVEGAGRVLARLVCLVDLRDDLLVEVRCHPGELVGAEDTVLRVADRGGELLGREALRVDVEVADDGGDQPFRVAVVVDREARRHAQVGVLPPEQPGAHRVEREDPHPPGRARAHQPLDPVAHLARRLVGEGDREDLARRDVALPHEVGDPVRQGPRLAAAGARDDEHGTLGVQDGLALDVVQAVEQRRWHVHVRSVGGPDDAPARWRVSRDFRSMVPPRVGL